jgi:hypothetical protein
MLETQLQIRFIFLPLQARTTVPYIGVMEHLMLSLILLLCRGHTSTPLLVHTMYVLTDNSLA